MRLILGLFCVLFLTSCSYIPDWASPFPAAQMAPKAEPIIHTEEATHIVQEYSVDMKYEHNIHLERAKTCYNENGIQTIQLEYITQDLIELCDARKLIVDLTENMLARLNQDTILGPEFASFPVRPENLEIYIVYESYFGEYVDPRYIYWICMEDGAVDYYTWELMYLDNRCWHCKHETYATSREIVVYQREAEKRYEEMHPPVKSAFGSDRYYPEPGT